MALSTTVSHRSQAERSATTRALLIDATIALLLEQGVAHCSLAALAKRAGLTTGAVQHQFETKAKLMRAVVAERLFAAEPMFNLADLTSRPLQERCRALVVSQWARYRQPHYLAMWEIILGTKTDGEIQQEIISWQRAATRAHEKAIGAILADCQLEAAQIRSLQYFLNSHLRGLALLRTVEDDPAVIDEQLQLLGQALLSAVTGSRKRDFENWGDL